MVLVEGKWDTTPNLQTTNASQPTSRGKLMEQGKVSRDSSEDDEPWSLNLWANKGTGRKSRLGVLGFQNLP